MDVGDVFEVSSSLDPDISLKKSQKIDEINKIKDKVVESISQSASIILTSFIMPMMIFILILLGALQTAYPHESTFEQDLNNSMGSLGGAFYNIYNVGVEDSEWVKYFLIILGAFIYFTINEVILNVKKIWRSGDGMSAQEIIDSIDNGMKGVTDKSGSTFKIENLKGGNEYTK